MKTRRYRRRMSEWHFFTNHAHVLMVVAHDPDARVRDVAHQVGITERAAHRILTDLIRTGYLSRRRVGARNHYEIHRELPLRHALHSGHRVGDFLELFAD